MQALHSVKQKNAAPAKARRSRTRYHILIFLFFQLLLVSFLFSLKGHEEKLYYNGLVERLELEYRSVLASQATLARLVFDELINTPPVIALFREAAGADPAGRETIRRRLHAIMKPVYDRQGSGNLRLIHFHLPDGTSFLRMHKPEAFGDPLFGVRPSVRIANTDKRYVRGFETGRHFHGFRYVFPLSDGGKHLGSVEVSMPFSAIRSGLVEAFSAEYYFMLEKKSAEHKLAAGEMENYVISDLSDAYLYEKADIVERQYEDHAGHISRGRILKIDGRVKKKVVGPLAAGKKFATAIQVENKRYQIAFIPVRNVEGSVAGFLASYSMDATLGLFWRHYFLTYCLASFLVVLLLGLHWSSLGKMRGRLRFQQQLIDSVPTPVFFKDRAGTIQGCNTAYSAQLGIPREEIIGKSEYAFRSEKEAGVQQRLDRELLAGGGMSQSEMTQQINGGGRKELVVYKTTFLNSGEKAAGLIGVSFDVTERKKAEEAIRNSHAELDQIFNSAADGMRVIDRDFNVLRVNDTFLELTGMGREQLIGRKCYDVFRGNFCHTAGCPLSRVFSGERRVEMEADKIRSDGTHVTCIVTATPFRDSEGRVMGIIEDFKDISQRKELEEKLREMSVTDELTGLLNRRGFLERAERKLQISQRQRGGLFLLYADLDDMKGINDHLGHEAGDKALREAASVLTSTFRQTDVVGRLGGDEFAVLLFDADGSGRDGILARLGEHIRELNDRHDRSFDLNISLGIAAYDPAEACSIDELISRADSRMYETKNRRKAVGGASR